MKPLKIPSRIKDGKLSFNNDKARKQVNSLPDGTYNVIIERHSKRTHQQNAWFHAVLPDVVEGLRNMGFNDVKTVEDAKVIVKGIFFKRKYSNGVEEIEVVEGTSETDKTIFIERADEIINWAYQYLGIDIAPPNKQLFFTDEFYK